MFRHSYKVGIGRVSGNNSILGLIYGVIKCMHDLHQAWTCTYRQQSICAWTIAACVIALTFSIAFTQRGAKHHAAFHLVSLLFRLPSVASDAPPAAETNFKRHRARVMTPHCSSTDFTLVASPHPSQTFVRETQKSRVAGRWLAIRWPMKTTPFPGWLKGCLARRHNAHIHRDGRRRRRQQQVWRLNYPVNYRLCRTDEGGLAGWYISAWSLANERVCDRRARAGTRLQISAATISMRRRSAPAVFYQVTHWLSLASESIVPQFAIYTSTHTSVALTAKWRPRL